MHAHASQAFRRGHWHASTGKRSAADDYVSGSFAREDYESGYRAAQAEARTAHALSERLAREHEADHARRVCRVADALSRK